MRWTPGGLSGDVEDRRDEGGGGFGGFGGFGGRGLGLGGVLLLLVLSVIFGRNFLSMGTPQNSPSTGAYQSQPRAGGEDREAQFVSFVLDDVQNTWQQIFARSGKSYTHAKLVLFRDATESGCGFAQAASGPFYCPSDGKLYIDLSFYDELSRRFGAPGDFAQAYVIAHEVGHHVQDLLGIERKVRSAMQSDPGHASAESVRLELQADCLAGVWGHSTQQRGILEKGDVEEGLNAASAVGDDRLQRMAGRRVTPESFTHGSAAQRSEWFGRGFQSGDMSACDTFAQ